MKKLCVFDLDGTLVNSIYDIADAMNWALGQLGKKIYKTECYYRMVGNGMEALCRRALPDGKEEEVQTLIRIYKERYLANCCVRTCVYPGIQELLSSLKQQDVKIAVLSNKPQAQTERVLKELFPEDMFFAVIGQSAQFPAKPAPDALQYLIEQAKVDKAEVCHIGDSDVDMKLGCAAGVEAIGVTWGFRSEEELKVNGASAIVHAARELENILLPALEKN